MVADLVKQFGDKGHFQLMSLVCLTTTFLTEFASNTAVGNILVPILVRTAEKLCINPIYLGEEDDCYSVGSVVCYALDQLY